MDLTGFLVELKKIVKEQPIVSINSDGLLEKRITFPDFLENVGMGVFYNENSPLDTRVILAPDAEALRSELKQASFRDRKSTGTYHFEIIAQVKNKYEGFDALVDKIFRSRKNKLPFANQTSYQVSWTPEQILEESFLPRTKNWLQAVARTHDIGSPDGRISFSENSLDITGYNLHFEAKAKGSYIKHLPELANELNALLVVLDVKSQDLERLRQGLKNPRIYNWLRFHIENQPRRFLEGFANPRTSYDVPIRPYEIPIYEEALGYSLSSAGENQTHVKAFRKIHLPFSKQRLRILQAIARKMISIKELADLTDSSRLSPEQASEIIEREIKYYEKGFNKKEFNRNHHNFDNLIKLANCYVGEIISYYDNIEKSVNALKTYDYDVKKFSTKEQGMVKIAKHFLEFVKQKYEKDKEKFIANFIEYYKNHAPQTVFYTDSPIQNYKKIFGYSIPKKGIINGFSIEKNPQKLFMNKISILHNDYTLVSDELVIGKPTRSTFNLKISLDKPALLPFQTYVCEELGIKFS